MKRQIIKIDESKCTGCELCVTSCPEGALKVIDGKARLVGEILCDGLGACIGNCPEGAITIEEREAEPYDEVKVLEQIIPQGAAVLAAHLAHLRDHQQCDDLNTAKEYLSAKNIPIPEHQPSDDKTLPCGCPGSMMKTLPKKQESSSSTTDISIDSELQQWPIQLQLLNPQAPYFQEADLLLVADCVPFAYANFHQRFLKNKILVILCPKLDTVLDQYVHKLSEIIKHNRIKSLTVVHMEVPCCFGLMNLVQAALDQSGENLSVKEYTISLTGEIV